VIKQNKNTTKKGLLVAILLLGIAFLTVGCGKKEAPQEGKTAAVAETKETGRKGGDGKEDPGVVTLSQEKQKYSGNESLINRFEQDTNGTRFDERDIIRGSDSVLYDSSTRTDLPESNTVEFSFFNTLLRKTPRASYSPFESFKYNYNNFDVSKIFYIDISQGFLVGPDYEEFDDRLARLATSFGLSIGNFSLSGNEYYFHQNQKHITAISLTHTMDYFKYSFIYNYDSFSEQRRFFETDFTLTLSDLLELRTGHYYDLELQRVYESYVGALYSPDNNCWKFDLEYRQKDKIEDNVKSKDRIISFNFLLNYSSKGFNSLLGLRI